MRMVMGMVVLMNVSLSSHHRLVPILNLNLNLSRVCLVDGMVLLLVVLQ